MLLSDSLRVLKKKIANFLQQKEENIVLFNNPIAKIEMKDLDLTVEVRTQIVILCMHNNRAKVYCNHHIWYATMISVFTAISIS